jgi:putative ABC transport system permease protein
VVVGTLTLSISLSVGRGVDRAIVGLFHRDDRLRKIQVYPDYSTAAEDVPKEQREPRGTMSDEKRERIRSSLIRHYIPPKGRNARRPLTVSEVARIQELDQVQRVEPEISINGNATMGDKRIPVSAGSVSPHSDILRPRLIEGRLFNETDRRSAIVHEYLLYRWGLISDADVAKAIGKTFVLEYRSERLDAEVNLAGVLAQRWMLNLDANQIPILESAIKRLGILVRFLPMPSGERNLLLRIFGQGEGNTKPPPSPPVIVSETFTIVGVLREIRKEEENMGLGGGWELRFAEIILPTEGGTEFYLRAPLNVEAGFSNVTVTVDQEDQVKEVGDRIGALGFQQHSLVGYLATVRMNVMLISFATAFVAVVALLVAAIGITNTMVMSVLERTREIGIMMALGAKGRHIRLIFLVEGLVLGLCGGVTGLGLTWLSSIPGDAIARRMMEAQSNTKVEETLFLFPVWLVIGAPAVAALITTLGALYPAIRASRLDPVTSLRHE